MYTKWVNLKNVDRGEKQDIGHLAFGWKKHQDRARKFDFAKIDPWDIASSHRIIKGKALKVNTKTLGLGTKAQVKLFGNI